MQAEALLIFTVLASFLSVGMVVTFRRGLFSPYFLFFAYLFVGIIIRGFYLLDDSAFDEKDFWTLVAPLVQGDFARAYLELLTAIVIAVVASRVIRRIRNPVEEAFLRFYSFRSDQISFNATVLVALFSCVGFVAALGLTQGGLGEGFVALQKRALVFGSEMFIIRILTVVFSISVAMVLYKCSAEGRSSGLRKAIVAALVLSNISLLLLSGGRGPVVTQMVVLLYVRNRGLSRGGIRLGTSVLISVVGSLVLVEGMAMRRSAQSGINMGEATVDSINTAGHTVSGAFPITDLYLSARHFAHSAGHDHGMQFLLYGVRFVPRSIWEKKPFNLSYSIREFYYGDTLSGAPPTVFGEFFIAWGFPGIIGCGIFLGWMLSFLERAYRRARDDSAFALIYILLVPLLIFDGLRAGLEQAVIMILYLLVTLTCFKLASRCRRLTAKKPLVCRIGTS